MSSDNAAKRALVRPRVTRPGALSSEYAVTQALSVSKAAHTEGSKYSSAWRTLCHLEAAMVRTALDGWELNELDFLFIENRRESGVPFVLRCWRGSASGLAFRHRRGR